jgi:hypothetical protein
MCLLCASQYNTGGILINWQLTKVATAYKTVYLQSLDQWVDLERSVIVVIEVAMAIRVAGTELARDSRLGDD